MNAPRVLVAGAVLGQPMGGVRRHNAELLPRAAERLEARGGGLAVLAGRTPPAFPLPPAVECLASDVPAGPPLARALRESRALRAALTRARRAGRPFELVHTAHLPAPRRLDVPFTLTLHDLRAVAPGARARGLGRLVVGDAVRRAALVACVSAPVQAELRGRFTPHATALVPNGVDHLERLPREPAAGDERFLLHVGHLEPRKDLSTLVRALAADRALPPVWLAGAGKGDEPRRLQALAESLDVAKRVRLLGPVEDAQLPALYARCAAVVVPSRLEGFGLPALEALRAGAPLALSTAAARPLSLEGQVPTFAVGDAAACASALRKALAGAQAPAERVAALVDAHTWDAAADALVDAWLHVTRA